MEDNSIIELYFSRSEDALKQTQTKYGKYLYSIAYNILHNNEDAEECVNDVYQKSWEAIPPTRPLRFGAFLGKIAHNTALNRYRHNTADKRYEGICAQLDELEEMLASDSYVESMLEEKELTEAINTFLEGISKKSRILFVRRYWYMDSIREIAGRMGMTENNVKVSLKRSRDRLWKHLVKEGFLNE